LGELTRGCCSSRAAQATPVWPVLLTGLTGVSPCGILLGWTSWCVRCCPMLLLFRVWVSLVVGWPVWCLGGFQAAISLTGVSHWSDRCRATWWKLLSFTSRDRSDLWCSPVWPVWVCRLELWFSAAFLGSEGCVLVPRSSGTLVATWAWPTLVVSRRRVLETVFILLESPSPSRRIFIGSHSLPPSLVRRIGSSQALFFYTKTLEFLHINMFRSQISCR
jgi:hypothetical protein